MSEPGCRQTLRLGAALQANRALSHAGHQARNGMAVGCSAVGHPGVWDSTWGIMWDHGALWVTMGWSTVGYHSMWRRGLPWDKDSHRQYQTPALHSRLACSWELKMTQYSIAWMGGSATGACFPRDPVTPSLSPGWTWQSLGSRHRHYQGWSGIPVPAAIPALPKQDLIRLGRDIPAQTKVSPRLGRQPAPCRHGSGSGSSAPILPAQHDC